MSVVAAKLAAQKQAAGAESVAFGVTSPSGAPISDAIDWIERFFRLFGSPNCCYSTEICNWHKDYACRPSGSARPPSATPSICR